MIELGAFCFSEFCFKYAYLLLAIIPVIILLFIIIRKDFIKFKSKEEKKAYRKDMKSIRIILFVLRSMIFSLLIIAIASPFMLRETKIKGDPTLLILVDNSTSFELFDNKITSDLMSELKKEIPVNLKYIGKGEQSAIGDGILANIQGDDNILVISDGNNNKGRLLGDIVTFAASINSTINTVDISPIKKDSVVNMEGPSEVILDSKERFKVNVKQTGDEVGYHLQVLEGNTIVLDKNSIGTRTFAFEREFSSEGYYKLTAKITDLKEDHFDSNNVYYKSIRVLARPKILVVTNKQSPLLDELENQYSMVKTDTIPEDLNSYFAVILDDMHYNNIGPKLDLLTNYVSNGGGLLVMGGESSYERGSYKGSLFETLLPVRIGTGEGNNETDTNIVVVIDASHGTELYIAVNKALAISVIDSLNEEHNVGVIAFNIAPWEVHSIAPLIEHKNETVRKIARLKYDSQSFFNLGVGGAHNMLRDVGGGKNIILITDGKTTYEGLRKWTRDAVSNAASRGIKTYVVGVGEGRDDVFLTELSLLGNGIYFPADATNRIKILFGEPTDEEKEFFNKLVILESTHFITYNVNLDAVISGYNFVIPKPAARTLITTNKNIPILVVWRFGLGRVATWATDDTSKWSGELLSRNNSRVIMRTINWVIGDLSKKKEFDVRVKDTSLGKDVEIIVISPITPRLKDLKFVKVDINKYRSLVTKEETGFYTILNATYAVNYNKEYENLGVNEEFREIVKLSGGQIFDPTDYQTIASEVIKMSNKIRMEETNLKSPFIILVLILFLLDITIRKIREKNKVLG